MKSLLLSLSLSLALSATAHPSSTHSEHLHEAHAALHEARALPTAGLELGPHKSLLSGYSLTWQDEFNYPTASLKQPSTSNWIYDTGNSYPGGPANWGSNELQTYTNSVNNIYITPEGWLKIIPRKDSNGKWTSARIETVRKDFKAKRGGKLFVEAKIKTGCAYPEFQQGIWNAFWALGADFRGNYQNWPYSSEWDILEVINGQNTIYNTLHCGTNPGGVCNEPSGLSNGGVAWTKCAWHYVGFEVDRTQVTDAGVELWRNNKLTWYVDGVKTHELTGRDVNDYDAWYNVAYQGHFLLLNVAIGGDWPGAPNAQTKDSASTRLMVDYVRVWNQ